jgi:phosphotransferase system enzyme I (PtsI)
MKKNNSVSKPQPSAPGSKPLGCHQGVSASPGICIGPAYLAGSQEIKVRRARLAGDAAIQKELARLQRAVEMTREEINGIRQKVAREVGLQEADIFNAYMHMLEDPMLIAAATEGIRKEKVNAECVLQTVTQDLVQGFKASPDEYLRERVADLLDVVHRLMRNLTGQPIAILSEGEGEVIVVARDLTPSQTASMKKEQVIGFVTEIGGRTSHVAIMARSLEIPAVVGLKGIANQIQSGDLLIVDGAKGMVWVNPEMELLLRYRQAQQHMRQAARKLKKLKGVTAVTRDGYRLTVAANIELPEDVQQARNYGAEGIGLFRTEFLYMNRPDLPTEDEQYEAYKSVVQQSLPYATVIRTLDLGGDKFVSRLGTSLEVNPFLGLRAIRLCLAHRDLFRTQLRAILRASVHGKIKIMFPMISGIEEFLQAREVYREVQSELSSKREGFDKNLEVGMMIEVPSAALTADILAKEADFFSIGTNDLIQYTLAADRVNERVAYLYDPLHPSILRLIQRTIQAAHEERIWVGMCGEVASDTAITPLLVGMGLDEFSTGPAFVPQIKKAIRDLQFAECRDLAQQALACQNSEQVQQILFKQGEENGAT